MTQIVRRPRDAGRPSAGAMLIAAGAGAAILGAILLARRAAADQDEFWGHPADVWRADDDRDSAAAAD